MTSTTSAGWCASSARAARSAPCPMARLPLERSSAGSSRDARRSASRGQGRPCSSVSAGDGSTSGRSATWCTGVSPRCRELRTSAPTACGTPPPPICWRAVPTCARCRSSSGTPLSPRRSSTPTSPQIGCAGPTSRRTRGRERRSAHAGRRRAGVASARAGETSRVAR